MVLVRKWMQWTRPEFELRSPNLLSEPRTILLTVHHSLPPLERDEPLVLNLINASWPKNWEGHKATRKRGLCFSFYISFCFTFFLSFLNTHSKHFTVNVFLAIFRYLLSVFQQINYSPSFDKTYSKSRNVYMSCTSAGNTIIHHPTFFLRATYSFPLFSASSNNKSSIFSHYQTHTKKIIFLVVNFSTAISPFLSSCRKLVSFQTVGVSLLLSLSFASISIHLSMQFYSKVIHNLYAISQIIKKNSSSTN